MLQLWQTVSPWVWPIIESLLAGLLGCHVGLRLADKRFSKKLQELACCLFAR
jgi:hypothetical protein